ncbi:hypothetical protein PC116_g23222 [Phytophthora cactorum]|uniref:Uncharacterized protein n=1 Tax=Phytophthora cactorum TaxID=29920 RepID=A0A8T1BJ27_9STRA|nr:hypothetical protein Pcac1_g28980 [Phytophthora cactorum]KAG2758929.1 hypothetical protein Pcac1_g28982 [Phytophthora cactorum]KAG2758930.1 hypothetical protein Pcac1_g28983 [Phytophthora cactorum]KAG2758931.1 hypothetical protein Pcac1_g28986 [Phytophthora cactorum]KAG2758932.1 hypothetical protein Pcac1_g28988 [Phytophthora cactorum]
MLRPLGRRSDPRDRHYRGEPAQARYRCHPTESASVRWVNEWVVSVFQDLMDGLCGLWHVHKAL